MKLKSSPSFNPKLVALIMISKLINSFLRFVHSIIFRFLNFFFKKIHFSLVLLIIEISLTPDFCNDNITEGETPPAPMIKAFFFANHYQTP